MMHADDDMFNELAKTRSPNPMQGHGNHDGHFMPGSPNESGADIHAGHSMGGGHHGGMDHGDMVMMMYFHFGYKEIILFSFWTINSIGGLIGSMIGIFLTATLYEGLKVFREFLLQRTLVCERINVRATTNQYSGTYSNGLRVPLATDNGDSPDGSAIVNPPVKTTLLRPHPFSVMHTLQAFLHMLQVFVSYLLMLVFMTYNVWLAFAVVLGAGAGYFLFGWRKKTIVDINEHCH